MNTDQGDTLPHLVAAPALPRVVAFALDAATYLIIPALLLPLGLLLVRHGVVLNSPAVNAIGLVLVIAPATAWATWCESRPPGATPGKRVLRLRVLDQRSNEPPRAAQSLARNVIKIAVPWELGHIVALGYANSAGSVPVWLWVLAAVLYSWLLLNLVLLIMRSHQPLHDRLPGTIVVHTSK
jgi:uncharacterized RDD family membrane protein YckC